MPTRSPGFPFHFFLPARSCTQIAWSVPIYPPGFLLSFSSFLYADCLKRAGPSAGLPFLVQLDPVRRSPEACRSVRWASVFFVQLDPVRRSPEACRSVRRAPFFFVHVVPVPFDSTHVWFQVSCVVLQQNHQSCAPPQGMLMRCVLHANEAHNLLEMWWCLTDEGNTESWRHELESG